MKIFRHFQFGGVESLQKKTTVSYFLIHPILAPTQYTYTQMSRAATAGTGN